MNEKIQVIISENSVRTRWEARYLSRAIISTFSMLCVLILTSAFPGMAMEKHKATIVGADGTVLQDEEVRTVHIDDSLALVAFYHSTNGDQWIEEGRAGWLVDPVVHWEGVDRVDNVGTDVDPEWRVTRFGLARNVIVIPGPIPPEFGNMEHLQRFDNRVNQLSGNFPVELTTLEHFARFQARNNVMSGSPPWVEMSQMPSLDRWEVQNEPFRPGEVVGNTFNYFGGDIPAEIGNMPQLQRINLSFNEFTGVFPAEISNVETMERFVIRGNYFTGPMPDLGNLQNLVRYHVSHTNWDAGPFPEWLNNDNIKATLEQIYLNETNRTGEVPEWITGLNQLDRFRFGGKSDDLTGEIPDLSFMDNLTRLRIFDIGYSGPMPSWLADMPVLERLWMENVDITGVIPPDLAANTLTHLELTNLNLTGGVPQDITTSSAMTNLRLVDMPGLEVGDISSWIGQMQNLSVLQLTNVGLTGEFPADLQNIPNLEILFLDDNPGLTGTIPEWLQDRPIGGLDLSRTGMDISEIPAWLSNQENLAFLGLAGHGIEGEIPTWLGESRFLTMLALDDNNLTGSIPATLGDAQYMDSINLANNQLSGELPANFANVGRFTEDVYMLQAFVISGNENLTGQIPAGFTGNPSVRVFEYEGTGLCADDEAFPDWFDMVRDNGGVFRSYPLRHTSVKMNTDGCGPVSVAPDQRAHIFRLSQNYPNPFNPATVIQYEIPENAHVRVTVYNVIGQRVVSLVNETLSAGQYEVNFDAGGLASGTYLYQLEAGDRVQTQTMMLLK